MIEHQFFLAVTPKAAARTNVTCRGSGKRAFPTVYTAPGYRSWLDEAIPKLQQVAPRLPQDIRERDVRIDIEVVIRKPKSTKRRRPGGDNDNYEKGVWDAMTKVERWWVDDEQVVENRTTKRWAAPDEPEGYHVKVAFMER
jgi:Holliday junction resolvase RusA-like endonuclease